MKNALLVYSHPNGNIFNIGDYVQSIAARQFLPSVDKYLDREHLNDEVDAEVRLIMNGWYMHQPQNWPPVEKIKPLFVAFHLNKLAESGMLDAKGIAYLKQHQPIGCRDYHTVSVLKEKGIDAYFSGCLTLTLGATYQHSVKENAKVYLTDLSYQLEHSLDFKMQCARVLLTKLLVLKKIQERMLECGITRALKGVAAFYVTYRSVLSDRLMETAEYRCQEIEDTFANDDEKFAYADKLLKEYSEANFVVTSRIHCALPCLAMGTPVVFVTSDLSGDVHNCRFDGLQQLFQTITIHGKNIECNVDGIERLDTDSKFSNKPDYKVFAEALAVKCHGFFKDK